MIRHPKLFIHIRWMIKCDMPEVLGIEQDVFDDAWTEDDFMQELRHRNCIGMVAEIKPPHPFAGQIAGYMIYELHKTRFRLLNFAVHPACQCRGVGRQLVAKLVNKLTNDRRTHIDVEVRESNTDAQLFFAACDFKAVSVQRDFYSWPDGRTEAAYLMEHHIGKLVEPDMLDLGVMHRGLELR